jgi:CMP/dCMP kinase
VSSSLKVITIDGPAASGKSSVSREVARRLGWPWVSTGAFYRGLALVALREGVNEDDVPGLVALGLSNSWRVEMQSSQTRVFHLGEDITDDALSESNGTRASQISRIPEVRQALLQAQRACTQLGPGLIAEGRDCGSVVFPEAFLKVFLTASQEVRAHRRALEKGSDQRDARDASRAAAPMQVPQGAKVLDSNTMTLHEVSDQVEAWAREALAQGVKSF